MAPTFSTILDDLLAQRDALEAHLAMIQEGFSDVPALHADPAKMRAFGNAHDRREAIMHPLHTWMRERVWSHLAPRFAQGALAAIDHGIRTPFVDRWNTLVEQKNPPAFAKDDVVKAVADVIQAALGFATPFEPVSWDAATVEAFVDAGTVATPCRVSDDMLVCFYSGGNMSLTLDSWTPTHHTLAPGAKKKLVVATPRDDRALIHNSITFPTGRLLVADRMPFERVESVMESMRGLNINYALNRILRSTLLCQTQGIVQISADDSGPSVHFHGGDVVVGHAQGLAKAAGVDTDLWMVTMVDVATLLEMGVTQDEIDAALAEGEVESLDVAPGTWHVVWSEEASTETSAARFAPLYPHQDGDDLMFWMTQDIAPVQALEGWRVVDMTHVRP